MLIAGHFSFIMLGVSRLCHCEPWFLGRSNLFKRIASSPMLLKIIIAPRNDTEKMFKRENPKFLFIKTSMERRVR